jgi:superfamily II DNA or RNA helicase
LGPVLFVGSKQRLKPKVKRVWTKFKLVKTDRFNPSLANRTLLLRFLCASHHRNDTIADQVIKAVAAGRKCLVLSERINHLERVEARLKAMWPQQYGAVPSMDYYVGGRKKSEYAEAAKAQVIFATSQYAAEGLDIPALDTLFLISPMSDVEQAVGRIQRPAEGKKEPIVVDFRDDSIPMFAAQASKREKLYERIC